MSTDFNSCPKCGSDDVDLTSGRDGNIFYEHVQCEDCGLQTFEREGVTEVFTQSSALDRITLYEITARMYNRWTETRPTRYGSDNWGSK